ncbi:Inhibitor of the KinA pathway to sporulation, predicted exonuclease [Paenibacillus sp. UNCCL117]|uniref:3'-5' exonuclease n=1 Tax=unclassified Paenibacillus TaxID=185978 RepID=UPI000886FF9D|nr:MULTISPECIES: 3'-5' exonuclease [unclassified Paenibacillus]SDD17755.1 Inhibitor of the KinA pathway to sporulation, predicted exonuclease [Paenibacillus sp. cl123]SFW35056.1 Inhibitor of the KinA pathway to sporulation, predicted exonuclease [Paenibacillus sp. UNCCL117]
MLDYIILDIEFNGRKFASELPMEVIEIGAVRLSPSLETIDEFTALIKPVYFSKLNSFIKKKTGIPQEDIDRAAGFVPVIKEFSAWLQRSESFLLFTWGGEDMKRIVQDTRMHKLDDSFWLSAPYFDLLKGYTRYKKVTNDVSVEAALLDLEITAEGSAHRALDDARMTAEVFRRIFPSLDLQLAQFYKDSFSNAKERRLVKNAIRSMAAQKTAPDWGRVVEHYLTGKVPLTDPRKVAELQAYFEAELQAKPLAPKPAN